MSAWVRKVCAACGLSAAQDDDDAAAAASAAVADENDQGRNYIGTNAAIWMNVQLWQRYFLIELLKIAIASLLSNFSLKKAGSTLGR